jgi:CCR4-NOT transcription complex subunit 1
MKFFTTKNFDLIPKICDKMMASKEHINGRIVPNSSVINAVILFIVTQVCNEKKHGAPESAQRDNVELLKQMAFCLNDETRLCFLNSIVNELRYPNSHTFYFCMILLILFYESNPVIKEQISTILFERLQAQRPYPWGLMINFRELIQNNKYGFMRSDFIAQNQIAVTNLFKHRLRLFIQFI